MTGKSKRAGANDEQLVELLFGGGPRVATNAYMELSTRVRDVTLPCIRAARTTASGETAEQLDGALAN